MSTTPGFDEALAVLKAENARACEAETTRLGLALVAEIERLQGDVARLSATKTLDDCRGFHESVNEACTCGGGGSPDCCPACEVYHSIKHYEVKP